MVQQKQAKRKRDIKTKLMAAICMLLVSSIMMVSTTYAWFTLSTAPEVTGINTAVGANGNLEIALVPKTGDLSLITSNTGDSMLAIERKNVTWGNLVDLSDSSVYGLDSITLYPAALNATYGGVNGELTSFGSIMLQTPTYGSDGRVATLNPNTTSGYYDATEKNFYTNTDMGVRAVGTASGMTDRQLVYRNARSAASTSAASAKTVASQSLNTNGSTLANIAIKRGTSGTNATFDQDDVASLQAIVNDLLGTESKTGVLQHIENAYMQYILAYAASAAIDDVDSEEAAQAYKAVQALVDAENATLSSVVNGLSSADVTLDTALSNAITGLQTTRNNVETANTTLSGLTDKATVTWSEISGVLTKLADPDKMTVNGILASQIMQGDNMSNLVNSVASGGLKVTMSTGGGVYADVADHCGDYTASVVIEEVTYNGLTLKNMTARMETASTLNTAYLTSVGAVVETAGAPASGDTSDQPITDMFGYVVDLAFRTNAAESNLLLQKDAVDRIYGDNDNAGTMGHGSNMTFQTVSSELKETQIRELMNAIRLVFFTPGADSNTVILCGKLDGTNATLVDGTWTANISLYKETENADGSITETAVTDNVIMALPQNTATQLSVLVYLDGNHVGNEDVAASAATSLVGQLNLQFASSATLVPMDYSQLHTPSTSGGNTGATTEPSTEAPTVDPAG